MDQVTQWVVQWRKNGQLNESAFDRYADATELADSLEYQGRRVKILEKVSTKVIA